MMEHSSVTLRWMGLGFHQHGEERGERTNKGIKRGGEDGREERHDEGKGR